MMQNTDKALEQGVETLALGSPAKKTYNKHALEFKLKVINLAKKSSNRRQTVRENNVNESLIRHWIGEEESIKEALAKVINTKNLLRKLFKGDN